MAATPDNPNAIAKLEFQIPANGVLPHAEECIKRAQKGEKLSKDERRLALKYIRSHYPDQHTKAELSDLFQVDESTIRFDLKQLRKDESENVREETDAKLVINDLLHARDLAITKIARSLAAMEKAGRTDSNTYLRFVLSLPELHMKVSQMLQDMGLLPKTLGTVTVNKNIFKAIVEQRTGQVTEVRPLNLFDDMRDGESLEELLRRKALEQAEAVQEAEFVMLPAAPTEGDAQKANEQDGTPSPQGDEKS